MFLIKKITLGLFIIFGIILPQTTFAIDFLKTDNQELKNIIKTPQLTIDIPGLNFSTANDIVDNTASGPLPGGKTGEFLVIPFLGQYISVVYKYAVVIAGILAVLVIIVSGLQWTASAGSSEIVGSAKTRILNAVFGLIIAVGSYTILYVINPTLVSFENLKVFNIESVDFPEPSIDSAGAKLPEDTNASKKPESPQEMTPNMFTKQNIFNQWEAFTDVQKKEVLPYLYITIAACPAETTYVKSGIDHSNLKNQTLSSTIIPKLKDATILAEKYGFEICINSASRTIKRQAQLWNTGIVKRYASQTANWQKNQGLVAKPTCSAPHNSGAALDMSLKKKDTNKAVVSGDNNAYKTPTITAYKSIYFTENPPYKLIFEEIMKQAGFTRYCTEYWHFEGSDLTERYKNWDKDPQTRCTATYQNWKVEIPQNVKDNANKAVQNGPLFK